MSSNFSKGYETIIDNYNQIAKKFKIYIYDFHPPEFKSIKEFVHHTINDKGFDWAETYKSWLYFMYFVMNSPMYTEDPSVADLFFVPQYEFVYRWKNFKRDYIEPLEKAINSEYYKKSYPKRNHIIAYSSDHTVYGDFRIPNHLKDVIRERFFRISYSGRLYKFGKFHNNTVSDTMFDFDPAHEVVVPPGIPLNYYTRKPIKRYHENDIMYIGTLNPINKLVERRDALKYMSQNFTIKDKDDSYFGIHCAGAGIWTARFYNYLTLGIIPICFSDVVLMPFETFFNYRSFSLKILSQTCDQNKQDFVEKLKSACAATRDFSKDSARENSVSAQIYKMQDNVDEVADWFNWRSETPLKNPFTLTIIELYNKVHNCFQETENPVAKEEFYDFNESCLPLYKTL
jgi:hypothetical protein